MRIASNSLQPAIHKNRRSLVLVGASDNELLAACGELYGYIAKGSLWAFGSGLVVACVWFLCVAFRAGVLTW